MKLKSLLKNFTSTHPLSGIEISRSHVTIHKGILQSQVTSSGSEAPTTRSLGPLNPIVGCGILSIPTLGSESTEQNLQRQSVLLGADKQIDRAGALVLYAFCSL